MIQIIEKTEQEIRDDYNKLTKTELIEMLIYMDRQINTVIKNGNFPVTINSEKQSFHVHLMQI